MNLRDHIISIADSIVFVAEKFMEHPDDIAKIHSVTMLVDREIIERMKGVINDKKRVDQQNP